MTFDHDWNDTSILPTSGKEIEEKEFDITISHTMSVMAESYEDAVEWVKDHVATQSRYIDFDVQ